MIKVNLLVVFSLFTSVAFAQELATVGPIFSPPLSFDGVRFVKLADDQSNLKVYFAKTNRLTKQKAVSLDGGKVGVVHFQVALPVGDLDSVTIPLEKLSLRDRSGALISVDEIKRRLVNVIPVFCMIGKETDYARNDALIKLIAPDAIILQIDRNLTIELEQLGLLTRS